MIKAQTVIPRPWFRGKSSIFVAGALLVVGVFLPCAIRAQPTFEVPLYFFGATTNDGVQPMAGLVSGPDNALYGTTSGLGISNVGTIFKISRDGSGYRVIHQFTNNPDGASPFSALRLADDGLLYGITEYGGTNNAGTLFRISLNGSLYQVLRQFNTNIYEAQRPGGQLLQANDGVLYGTAANGGTNGFGAVFRLSPDGTGYRVLHSFANSPDGANSQSGLIQAGDGLLYGTTPGGGLFGYGTVFRLSTNGGAYQILHNFTNTPDGNNPQQLLQARDGSLWSITSGGGVPGLGTIFQMNLDGSGYHILHNFTNGLDARIPLSGLTQAADGTLYGVSYFGGANNEGAIYRIDPGGANYSVVYSFSNNPNPPYSHADGSNPHGVLLAGSSTDNSTVLYGTTANGGPGFGNLSVYVGSVFGFVVNPGLTITPLNNQNVVMWPAWALNYVLQTTTNLSSGPWTTVTNGVPLAGLQLTNTTFPANSYFRLVWPQ